MQLQIDDDERDDLFLSCRYGDVDDVKEFVKKHGNSSLSYLRDDNQNTVLHMVSANGHLDLLKYLLEIVPPSLSSTQNNAGSTPLHWAALNSQLEVAKALVGFPAGPGVDLIDIKNAVGHSPLADAELSGWDEGARWLVEVMNLDPEENGQDEADSTLPDGQDIMVEIEDASGEIAKISISKGSTAASENTSSKASS
ncbi:cytoplasmic protein [Coprinopsis marcescibilis]|uniref:Cytoplasmic protein n=1 Tax=Coprinopsis marcescibilis TaxID=230819 RepID=A0A5C3KPY1_COPMA|nr:cytoplasmic protein [Coprinopsis marcescibilis]